MLPLDYCNTITHTSPKLLYQHLIRKS